MDVEKLQTLVRNKIQESMAKAFVPSVAITYNNPQYRGAWGYWGDTFGGHGHISVESHFSVDERTLFRIGSVSKPLTGTMMMKLVELGYFDLDRPLNHYLTDLKFTYPSAEQKITLRMLLSHTAGLPTGLTYDNCHTRESYVHEVISKLEFVAPPNTAYHYSNHGINLAGYIAEILMGQSYESLMSEYLFQPLGMTWTTFDPMQAITYPLVLPHELDKTGKLQVKRPFVDNLAERPCGFAMSNVYELSHFVRMHLNKGKIGDQQFLLPQSITEMHKAHGERFMLFGDSYGLTFRSYDYKGIRLVGHNGAIHKYGCLLWFAPEHNAGVVILCNRAPNFWGHATNIVHMIFDELLGLNDTKRLYLSIPEPKAINWNEYRGYYLGASTGLAQIDMMGDYPVLTLNGKSFEIQALRDNISLARSLDGSRIPIGIVDDTRLMINGALCTQFDYQPHEITIPQNLAGSFIGDIDTFTIRISENQLYLHSGDDRAEYPAIALDENRYVGEFGMIEFITQDHLRSSGAFDFYRA